MVVILIPPTVKAGSFLADEDIRAGAGETALICSQNDGFMLWPCGVTTQDSELFREKTPSIVPARRRNDGYRPRYNSRELQRNQK